MGRKWKCPKLIVLCRNHSDEAVLAHCKHGNNQPLYPEITHDNCNQSGGNTNCGACQANASS